MGREVERGGPRWAPAVVEAALRSPAEPLPEPVIAAEQPKFSIDLRKVRVHTGGQASAAAAAIGAVAFAAGRHVVFRTGSWAPETAAGRALLRHELTHVAEQGAAEPSPGVRLALSAGGAAEAGAEAAERGTVGPARATELRIAAKAERPEPAPRPEAVRQAYDEIVLVRAYQNEVKAEREALVEFVGTIVQVVGRSALVGLTGPVGLAGLASAIVAIGASYGLRELLLGSNYDALSRKNLANLATEVSGAMFEVSGVEKHIKALVTKLFKRSEFGKTVGSELLKTVASEVFDGVVEHLILQNGLPQLPALEAKAAAVVTQAALKGMTKTSMSERLTHAEPLEKLWAYQTLKVVMGGPPPPAALPRAMFGAIGKFGLAGAPELTDESLAEALWTAFKTSAGTSLSVATAFTAVKLREFREAESSIGRDERSFFAKLEQDDKLRALYDAQTGDKPPLAEWALRTAVEGSNERLRRQVAAAVAETANKFDPDSAWGTRALLRPFTTVRPTTNVLGRRK